MADKTVPLSDESQSPDFEAELPLPIEDSPPAGEKPAEPTGDEPALKLIRKKLSDAYNSEPSVAEEAKIVEKEQARGQPLSSHQQFLEDLARSGKSAQEMTLAWHEYYAGLTDQDKKRVWDEFEDMHKSSSAYKKATGSVAAQTSHPSAFKPKRRQVAGLHKALAEARRQARYTVQGARSLSPKHGLKSLGFGLVVGAVVVVIFLFGLFNERFIAPLIQPSRSSINTSIITGGAVGARPELVIPKINLEVPVVYDVTTTDTKSVQAGLQRGVLHYADTAQPGQNGNLVIVGHSSNNILNPGQYKFAFVLLHKLATGDTFYIQKSGKRYVYQVYKREIVGPNDTSVLAVQDQTATASLITCDPPGTSTNRLVVVGRQISPSIASNKPATSSNAAAVAAPVIPGNSPSLWSRLYSWLTH